MITVATFNRGRVLKAAVLYGEASRIERDGQADKAYFSGSAMVLYQLTTQRIQTFLFRGLGSVKVPGVTPSVNLIAHATNATQSRKLVRAVHWLAEQGHEPAHLSDARWLRVAAFLNEEKYGVRQLKRLLQTQS